MKTCRHCFPLTVCSLVVVTALALETIPPVHAAELTVSGTKFLLDGRTFPYTGVSFFNAIYNPTFNSSSAARGAWLKKFQRYGINVLRVWCQWDNARGFVDGARTNTLYQPDGSLRAPPLATLKAILLDADQLGIERAVAALTRELMPFRNAAFQIWNEHTDARVLPLVRVIKSLDPKRLVTNSPGFSSVLGSDEENTALDFLTPHTARQGRGRHWEIAPRELEGLLKTFHKPVVDDEPARTGTAQFGGPKGATSPYDHIAQILNVWRVGAHPTYHHDMFQTGYGTPACPPSGIPDPEFSPYHRQVFEFLAQRERYGPAEPK
ncbi:MAG: hypothetical protein NTW03_14335 [Verrucomicrobia bacterium]|nr:hypothetical protein [Verrucomicrobiota bacterium]